MFLRNVGTNYKSTRRRRRPTTAKIMEQNGGETHSSFCANKIIFAFRSDRSGLEPYQSRDCAAICKSRSCVRLNVEEKGLAQDKFHRKVDTSTPPKATQKKNYHHTCRFSKSPAIRRILLRRKTASSGTNKTCFCRLQQRLGRPNMTGSQF